MPGAPKTLEELAQQAQIEVADFRDFREDDFDRLTDELGINTTTRVRLWKIAAKHTVRYIMQLMVLPERQPCASSALVVDTKALPPRNRRHAAGGVGLEIHCCLHG